MTRRLCYFWQILLALLLLNCSHKELDFNQGSGITLTYDWSVSPDASPSVMSLIVFSGEAQPVTYTFYNPYTNTISLIAGRYQLVSFNDDTESLLVRGSKWSSVEIYSIGSELANVSRMFAQTRTIPRAANTDDQPIIYEPERLWTSVVDDAMIEHFASSSVTMKMEEATCVYSFTIKNVENLSYVKEMAATISGVPGSWFPALHEPSATECIIPFLMEAVDESTIKGSVRVFGKSGHYSVNEAGEHYLVIYAEMKDGAKVYYTVNATDIMSTASQNAGDGTGDVSIPIEIDGLPLPKPITNGSGFQPTVDQWEEIRINIPMG